jgi:hypothetical protein
MSQIPLGGKHGSYIKEKTSPRLESRRKRRSYKKYQAAACRHEYRFSSSG